MKRVQIFNEALSPACFIYYTLASSPQVTLCLLIFGGTLSFRVRELPRLCEQCFRWNCREYWEREGLRPERAGQQGIERGPRPIPFLSSSAWPKFPLVFRTLWLGKKECPTRVRRHRVACGACSLHLTCSQNWLVKPSLVKPKRD